MIVRRPIARLLLGGALLLAAERSLTAWNGTLDAEPETLHIAAARIAAAERAFVALAGRTPDARERAELVRAEVDDEILYRQALERGLDARDPVVQRRLLANMAFVSDDPAGRSAAVAAGTADVAPGEASRVASRSPDRLYREALALGMDRDDVVVRRRLVSRMRHLLEEAGAAHEPGVAELEDALRRHAERFTQPAQVRLSHVLASAAASGNAAPAQDAAASDVESLRRSLPDLDLAPVPAAIAAVGERMPLRKDLPLQGERDLERVLGASFARQALALPPGGWHGPIASPYGEHLVWVHQHVPAAAQPLASVRNQVRELVRDERARAALRRALDELRRGYRIVVEEPARDDAAPGASTTADAAGVVEVRS